MLADTISSVPAAFMTFGPFLFSAGVVPEPESKMAKEGTLWSDATGPNAFLDSLRAASSNPS